MMIRLVLVAAAFVLGIWINTDQAESQSNAPFCVTWAGGTECSYYSAQDCRRTATDLDGACVANNGAPSSQDRGSNWFNNALGSYDAGARARADREARQTPPTPTRDPFISQFCDRMLDHDMALLNEFASRLTPEEFNAAANSYVNRATYCQRMANGERP
jgi:hypothetical protein